MREFSAFFLSVFSCCVFSQEYPSRAVRVLVGYPPGGGMDTIARILAPAERPPGVDQPEPADQEGRNRQSEIVRAGITHDVGLAQKLALQGRDGALEARIFGFDPTPRKTL